MTRRLGVGLIGLGRLGRVYARDLSSRVPEARLVAVADSVGTVAEEVAREHDVPRSYPDALALIADPAVEAVVIVSPTHTHKDLVAASLDAKKPTFCEKPPALTIPETLAMRDAVTRSGVFFQMGFMRRFDSGFAAAKRQADEGVIGRPVVFKSTSRDPFRPSLEYADPKSSGGLILDMGVHDFDLARWYMGEVRRVHTVAGTLAYPELATVNDLDNAIVSLEFADGRLGVVDLTRNGIYGYDISAELLGTEGTLRIGYLRETPLYVMKKNAVTHDTVPFFMERFGAAYTAQLQNFVENVIAGRPAPVTIEDGLGAIRIAVAAHRSYEQGARVNVGES
jgi:inositol 2-dehydrogenase